MVLTFEDLPNELLLFIFGHLSAIDLLLSFYRLNRRFSSLVRTIEHFHVDFSSHSLSKTQFIHILNHLRSLHIESIRISTRYYVDIIPLLISYIPPSQLTHLRSLTLIDVDRNAIEKFVHNQLPLTSISIETSLWRSIPHRFLPHFSNLRHCTLPTLDLLSGCHTQLIDLTLNHCTTDNLIQLNTFVPNLHSLTLTLNITTNIPVILNFPMHLSSLRLVLKSVLFSEFERLITMIDWLENLTVSFSNTEHEVHCFDQYLFGSSWFSIKERVRNLQFNIIIHRTLETFFIADLLANFHWFNRRIVYQTIDSTNGYHLFTLPFIDRSYTINSIDHQNNRILDNDFDCVQHLHLIAPSENLPNYIYRNLRIVTVIAPCLNSTIMSFIDYLISQSRLQTLELRLTSTMNHGYDCFDKLIYRLPSFIETLILNTISTKYLSELLDNNNQLLPHIKRLLCSVKNREQFDILILNLFEIFDKKSLIYLNISLETSNKSSNLLSGWLLKTNYLKKARIKSSDRQCAIWI